MTFEIIIEAENGKFAGEVHSVSYEDEVGPHGVISKNRRYYVEVDGPLLEVEDDYRPAGE